MAIRLHCDRCGRYVSSMGEPKDLSVFKQETICKHCQKAEERLTKLAETLRSAWLEQVQKLVNAAKEQVAEEVAKIKANYGKED